MSLAGQAVVTKYRPTAARDAAGWTRSYLRRAALSDVGCALVAGIIAAEVRFAAPARLPAAYFAFTVALPVIWYVAVALSGGYEARLVGVGSEEFRKVLNAAVSVTAAVAIASYAAKFDFARGYFLIALPAATVLDLTARYTLRKQLHRRRLRGQCMEKVIAVGHRPAVAELIVTLRRDRYHGMTVVGACLAGHEADDHVEGVPVCGGLAKVTTAVGRLGADAVAVLACPEMNGIRLRELAWELEKTGTDLCVAPALMDVAGPRTTIRPVAGLPVLHVDHPDLAGGKKFFKRVFDTAVAAAALVLLAPVFAAIAIAIRAGDHGPVFFRQVRVGRDGQPFRLYKFRTMVVDADQRKTDLAALNEGTGVLFKMRQDPRVTRAGAWLRRWSLDELPQLLNILLGDMALVGPRPALPEEVARYEHHMQRRLAVKPGITGLWQVSGRSDLSYDETVRLDVRYVENWSFMLDLQILWKTWSAVARGSGAY
ncbi:MAG: sugar transferase [Streptosporangiaceae bacterium]